MDDLIDLAGLDLVGFARLVGLLVLIAGAAESESSLSGNSNTIDASLYESLDELWSWRLSGDDDFVDDVVVQVTFRDARLMGMGNGVIFTAARLTVRLGWLRRRFGFCCCWLTVAALFVRQRRFGGLSANEKLGSLTSLSESDSFVSICAAKFRISLSNTIFRSAEQFVSPDAFDGDADDVDCDDDDEDDDVDATGDVPSSDDASWACCSR